jgi:hypothetical protein
MNNQDGQSFVLKIPCEDRSGEHVYEAHLIWELGKNYGLSPKKISDIWREVKNFDVLFSDETRGDVEVLFDILIDPRSVWFELKKEGEERPIGIAYITNIIPGHDAQGHIAFWDRIAGGREPLLLFLMEWVSDRYKLHRFSAQVPPYQAGVIRFVKKLGFREEGEMREAVLRHGRRWPLVLLGITKDELDESIAGLY